jgi:hypothetical protein
MAGDEAIFLFYTKNARLLRFARNDGRVFGSSGLKATKYH